MAWPASGHCRDLVLPGKHTETKEEHDPVQLRKSGQSSQPLMDVPPVTTLLLEGWIGTGLSRDTSLPPCAGRGSFHLYREEGRKTKHHRCTGLRNDWKFKMTARGSEER